MCKNMLLIPYPNGEVIQNPGLFVLGNAFSIAITKDTFGFASRQLKSWLTDTCNLTVTLAEPGHSSSIQFRESSGKLPKEGYSIYVSSTGCMLEAESAVGAFYAVQTFKQLIDARNGTIPCCEIHDSPSFCWVLHSF